MCKEGCDQLARELRSTLDYYSQEYDIFYCQVIGVMETLKMGLALDGKEDPSCTRLYASLNELIAKYVRKGRVALCDAIGLLEMIKVDILSEAMAEEEEDQFNEEEAE